MRQSEGAFNKFEKKKFEYLIKPPNCKQSKKKYCGTIIKCGSPEVVRFKKTNKKHLYARSLFGSLTRFPKLKVTHKQKYKQNVGWNRG